MTRGARLRCTNCQQEKPASAFRPNQRLRLGFNSWCRECQVARTRQWRADHREEILARRRKQWADRAAEVNERRRARYQEEKP
jgi:hypothetical protein